MNSVELAFTPALEQAHLIRSRQVSPLELVELYLERIGRLNSCLGSYFTVTGDRALAEARAKTEALAGTTEDLPPFYGVPISIKDLNPVAEVPCSYGIRMLKDQVAQADDGVVAKIKQAGFIILGKTATSQLGTFPYTEPPGFPPARNPWHLDYTPGGSSGGAAAAVAAGLCPIAQGSDGGGSIRGPASCCGLVGIKPSRGRVTHAPVGDRLSGLASDGPLAHRVADAAALLDAISGYTLGDPYWLPDPNPAFLTVAQEGWQELPSLRIGVATELPSIGQADAICAQAVQNTGRLLESLGHHLEPISLDLADLIEPFTILFQANTDVPAGWRGLLAFSRVNRWLLWRARWRTSGDYLRAVYEVQAIARKIVAACAPFDVVLLPTYFHPPIRVGEWANLSSAKTLEKIVQWIAPCPPFNASGQPAISIPGGFSPLGLPIGVQLVGRPAGESTLIALAAQLEQAKPWHDRHPPLALT